MPDENSRIRSVRRFRVAPRRAASALLLVLWALLVLSAAVIAMLKWTYNDLDIYAESNLGLEATAMAHSGVQVALNAAVTKNTPMLEEEIRPGVGFSVKMVSEGGKLNINWLLAGEDPGKLALLKLWLRQRGLDFQQTEILVDCMLDYCDPDNVHHLNGVEDKDGYHPPNRGRFISVDEIEQVYGSEPLTRTPGWKDQLTVYSANGGSGGGAQDNNGTIDITAASPDILRLIGLDEGRIQMLLTIRKGRDGVEGTIDDPDLKPDDLMQQLGLRKGVSPAYPYLAHQKDQTMHITSIGHSGKVIRQVEVVAVKGNETMGSNNPIKSWKE